MRMVTADEATIQSVSLARCNGEQPKKNRVKITFTDEAFDLMHKERNRHGWSPSDAINYMLSELDDWRSGRRRFVERRKMQG